jgi:hypothetical protein
MTFTKIFRKFKKLNFLHRLNVLEYRLDHLNTPQLTPPKNIDYDVEVELGKLRLYLDKRLAEINTKKKK